VNRRLALLLPVAILASLASLAPVATVVTSCAAAGSNHAALVVEHADGSVVTRCVAFDTGSISGEELLNRAGIAWSAKTFGGFGDAVCALDGEPAQYADCPGKDRYWAVFVARSGASWQLANVGISALAMHDGDAEGFRFVPAAGLPSAPVTPAGVCAAAVATQTPTPAGASTPRLPTAAAATVPHPPTGTMNPLTAPTASVASPNEAVATRAAGTPSTDATSGSSPPKPSVPGPSGGLDLGLMAAAAAGGGLAGLALLRLLAARRKNQ